MDPAEAHGEEIFEAIVDAGIRGDQEAFNHFREEWDRLGVTDEEGRVVSFGDTPTYYEYQSFCGHCQDVWAIWGIHFGTLLPGMPMMIHMATQCPAKHLCNCYDHSENDALPYGFPICQRCERSAPICECDDFITLGPCAMVELYDRFNGHGDPE